MRTETISAVRGLPHEARPVAQQFEALFIAQMLDAAHIGEAPSGFSGGAGEEQFSSFRRDALALALAQTGRFGIAAALGSALDKASKP